jgi:DNA-3-methyladenine glycosylase
VKLRPLPRAFFERDVVQVARELLGHLVVRRAGRALLVARLVEVEAYGGEGVDASAHSFRGQTPRCRVMFGPAGHAYVYSTHQGRCCLNVSVGGDGGGKAVLLRAAEVIEGEAHMRAARLAASADGPTRSRLAEGGREHELLAGPARLCTALGVDRGLDGADLCDDGAPVWLARGEPAARAPWTPRIGLNPKSAAFDWSWRAVVAGSRAISGQKTGGVARPRPARCPRLAQRVGSASSNPP